MKQERFPEEKIVDILREAEKGEKPIADLCREHGIAEFTFTGPGEPAHGEVEHLLSLRTADEYGEALEAAGFLVEDLLEGYPGSPPQVAGELRMIFLARKR